MPITVHHAFTSPLADGSVTQLVKPSNWNAPHIATYNAAGTEIIGAFSNANNVSFGTNASGYVTASASFSGGGGGVAISAGTNSTATGTVVFGSSAGNVTFGMGTDGYVTASAPAAGTAGNGYNSAQFTNSTANSTMPIVWAGNSNGSGNLTIGLTGSTVTASFSNPTQTAYVFSNSNNVTFGTNGSTVTATATFAQSVQPAVAQLNGSSGTMSLAVGSSLSSSTNGSSITFGLASNITTALQSAGAYITTQSAQAFSADASSTFQTLVFQDSNGVSFSNNAGALRVTHTLQYLSNTSNITSNALNTSQSSLFQHTSATSAITSAAVNTSSPRLQGVVPGTSGNTAGTLATITGGTFAIVGGPNITISQSSGTNSTNLIISAAAGGGGGIAASISGNSTSAGAGYSNITSGTMILAGGNNITLSQNGASITISGANVGGAQTGISGVAVSNTTYTSGTISFRDGNGVSFASGTDQALSITHSLQYLSNTSAITANALNTSAARVQAVRVGTATNAATNQTVEMSGTVSFSNLNGISFYSTASGAVSGVAASYTVPTVPTAYVSSVNGSSGAISLNVGSSLSSSTNGSSITFGLASNITTALAAASASNVSGIYAATAAGGGGTATLANGVSFTNGNGATFYTSVGNAIALSYTVPAVPTAYVSSINGSSGAISLNVGSSLSSSTNGSSITFGLASNITTALAAASASNVSGIIAGTASNAATNQTAQLSGAVSFANGSGVSFFTTANGATSGIAASVKTDYLTTAAQTSASNVSVVYAATNNTGGGTVTLSGGVSFANTNGLTFYTTTGNAVVASYTVPSVPAQTQQPMYFSAGTTSSSASTLQFGTSAANGNVTFAISGGSIVGSAPSGGGGTQSVYAVSNTTQSSSGTYTNGLSFAGAGIASVGVSNGSVVISVPAGGGAGDGVNIVQLGTTGTTGTSFSSISGTVFLNGGNNITVSQNNSNQLVISAPSGGGVGVSNLGNSAGNTGPVSDRMVFAGGANVTLSQSVNGGSATITVNAGLLNYYYPATPVPLATSAFTSGTSTTVVGGTQHSVYMYVAPMYLDNALSYKEVEMLVSGQATVAGTGSATMGYMVGVYSNNASTLSLVTSYQWVHTMAQSSVSAQTHHWYFGTNSTTNSSSLAGNVSASFTRIANIYLDTNANSSLSAGSYYVAVIHTARSSSVALGMQSSAMCVSQSQSTGGSYFGTTVLKPPMEERFFGVVSSTVSASNSGVLSMPSTIQSSQITNTGGSSQWRIPFVRWYSNN